MELDLADFPSGPVVKTLLPMQGAPVQCLVKELDPHALTKSSRAATRSHMPQIRPSTAKQINENKQTQIYHVEERVWI